ncbi:hypothetical protein DES36_11925 [Alkalibaculum bacchi]|uniref:Uncharacterized protein n=1 Tax=Alkalibaculum bacchi TaxID=645887 RepID=A0A366I005_9FIRM|nr:hypothetical protein [Alkalibaculum bacchi]RBP59300.1 hypothetical protein DES36_11925 [Alkalibaculum bacchi]
MSYLYNGNFYEVSDSKDMIVDLLEDMERDQVIKSEVNNLGGCDIDLYTIIASNKIYSLSNDIDWEDFFEELIKTNILKEI